MRPNFDFNFNPATAKKLEKLGIRSVRDLLYHFPARYEDFSNIRPISQIEAGSSVTASGKILNIKNSRTFRKRLILTEALVGDESGAIRAVWFNQPYLADHFKPGRLVNLSGKVVLNNGRLCFSNPAYEITGYGEMKGGKESLHTGRLVPVYPETSGLTSRWLRLAVKSFSGLAAKIPDVLPPDVKKAYALPNLNYALRQIHFPDTLENASLAKKRFAFEELFILQLFTRRQKMKLAQKTAPKIEFNEKSAKEFVGSLPYKLTEDQKKAAWQIIGDLALGKPMNRLLQGDVGSGKTVVAAMAAYLAAKAGYQTAFMAPTEILSRQHFQKIGPMLEKFKVSVGLLTSAEARIGNDQVTKKKFEKIIKSGGADIVIGTHSLIQKNVDFGNLGLVIIDEQHRFGVGQRAALLQSETVPHLLSMSATPIPRTLSLTVWGDLDLSLIKQMPEGRKKIITKIVPPSSRETTYDFIRNEIKRGRQAFVICPLIEDSPKLEVRSATAEYKKLNEKVFPNLKIGLLHGRLKAKEKEKIMADFAAGDLNILVSTAVVEVGIDVPNATVMMIEGADRFGLASIYQFRGRVGRGEHQSHCFLFTESASAQTARRLRAVAAAKNGFELAEKDLEIRGPGDFIGVRQSGLPDLAMASLTDAELIAKTTEAAKTILSRDPGLKNYPLLGEALAAFEKKVHFE